MGMKPQGNEAQSQLAPNLVSGPKDVGETMGAGYGGGGLVSSMKDVPETTASVGPNLVSHEGGSGKNPG